MSRMRAKMVVESVEHVSDQHENLNFRAVGKNDGPYPADGSDENNSFARWTPTANLSMSVTNPELIGKFEAGQQYYVDFTPAE